MNILQNFIKPNYQLCSIDEMYFTSNNKVFFDVEKSTFEFEKFGLINFDTYFNVFSITTWKKNCKFDDLKLSLKGNGVFSVKIYNKIFNREKKLIGRAKVVLDNNIKNININLWEELSEGLLFPEIVAIQDGTIEEIKFITNSKPLCSPKLGIVITHFNRKDYVLPSIDRINNFINEKELEKKVKLIIIDNSNNITNEEKKDVLVISNKNLGGSGGFTRGLLYLQENNFSHCLFMDDDASCETESIYRAYQIFAYSNIEKLAISGGLLDENKENVYLEKGATFDGVSHLLKSNYDMTNDKDILRADKNFSKIDYGGWWFFMFKIIDIKRLTFPYFVKGDDITFSLDNDFKIISPIGISCWAEKFGLKSNPFSTYLWTRFLLIQPLIYSKFSMSRTLKQVLRLGVAFAISGKYENVLAIIHASMDARKGPDFWIENIDTFKVREKIKSYNKVEIMNPINLEEYNPFIFSELHKQSIDRDGKYNESSVRRELRKWLLQGYLLPFMLKDRIILQEKDHIVDFTEIFRFKKILHYDFNSNTGFITKNSYIKFWKNIILLFISLFLVFIHSFALRKEYRGKYEYMTSENFWRKMLEIKK